MKLKTLAIATGVLAILALGGALLQRQLNAPSSPAHVGKPVLGEIELSRAALLTIEAGEDKVTLTAKDGVWLVEEQDAFPASEEKIRRFLYKLTGQIIQHKVTENPEKLAALGLLKVSENNDKAEDQKTATRFAINDEENRPLFELLIGNARVRRGQGLRAAASGGQYVRFPDAPAAYLIAEALLLDTKPQDWLKAKVFSFSDEKLVKSMRISVPGSKELVFERKDGESEWKLRGVAASDLDQQEANLLARRLRDLEVIQVAKRGAPAKELGRAKVGVVSVELFDKRSYRIEVGTEKAQEDFRFLTISGALHPTATDQKLKGDVEALNGVFADRVVGIYAWEGEQLLKKRADFVKKKK